jgi:tetratricopeptide (TPR) repeat protein
MKRNNLFVSGLLLTLVFSQSAAATSINANSKSTAILYSQADFHQRQQEAIASYHNMITIQRQYENEQKIRRLALDFTNRKDYFGLGKLFYNNGYMREAIAAYSKAIEVNPRDYLSYYLRAAAKGVQEDLRGAFADYDMAIAINPEFASAYLDRGIKKFKLKDKDGSLQDFRSAARIYKKQGDTKNLNDIIDRIQYLFKVPE